MMIEVCILRWVLLSQPSQPIPSSKFDTNGCKSLRNSQDGPGFESDDGLGSAFGVGFNLSNPAVFN